MKKLLFGTILALVAGCGSLPHLASAPGAGALAAQGKQGGGRQLLVMPEAGPAPLLAAIHGAKTSINIHMYLFSGTNVGAQVIAALVERAQAGVDVRVILDGSPFTAPKPPECKPPANPVSLNKPIFEQLTAAGVKVKWSDPRFRFTHQKSLLIDGQTAWIMTMNMTTSAFTVNREYVVIDREPSDVADVARLFAADWSGGSYAPKDPDLVVSPNNSRAQILRLIDSAKTSLLVQVEFMQDPEVVNHLAARQKAGVDVTLMLAHAEKSQCSSWDTEAEETKLYTAAGLTKFAFIKKVKLHAKAIVVDQQRAFVGSENFTTNSLNNNRELGIVLSDAAVVSQLRDVMAKDWAEREANGPGNVTDVAASLADQLAL